MIQGINSKIRRTSIPLISEGSHLNSDESVSVTKVLRSPTLLCGLIFQAFLVCIPTWLRMPLAHFEALELGNEICLSGLRLASRSDLSSRLMFTVIGRD